MPSHAYRFIRLTQEAQQPTHITDRTVTSIKVTAVVGGTFSLRLSQGVRFPAGWATTGMSTGQHEHPLLHGQWDELVYTLTGQPNPNQPYDILVEYVVFPGDPDEPPSLPFVP